MKSNPDDGNDWGQATWPEISAALVPSEPGSQPRVVAILPTGAVEAHGPHLPLATDIIIANAMAREACQLFSSKGWKAFVLPALPYAPAPFASGYQGTITLRRDTQALVVRDLLMSLEEQGVPGVILANAHFDPAHVGALYDGIAAFRDESAGSLRVVFPDMTRRKWAGRLTAEFQSGACHAGQYESSIVMAAEPESVPEEQRAGLPEVPVSLSDAIRDGKTSFSEAGIEQAYCGNPDGASQEEGHRTVATLGGLLVEAFLEEVTE